MSIGTHPWNVGGYPFVLRLHRLFLSLFVLAWVFGSCSLAPSRTGLAPFPMVEQRSNGYLLSIPPTGRATEVGAFITRDVWLILTVVDPDYDPGSFDGIDKRMIDSLTVSRFPSATQLSLRFTERLRGVEIVKLGAEGPTLLSVFREQ